MGGVVVVATVILHVEVNLLGVKVGERAVDKASQRVVMLEVVHQLGHDLGVEGDHDAVDHVGEVVGDPEQSVVELQRYGSEDLERERQWSES